MKFLEQGRGFRFSLRGETSGYIRQSKLLSGEGGAEGGVCIGRIEEGRGWGGWRWLGTEWGVIRYHAFSVT